MQFVDGSLGARPAETAIRHLQDARLWIGGRGARLLLPGHLFLVGLAAPDPLGLDLGQLVERGRHPLLARNGAG